GEPLILAEDLETPIELDVPGLHTTQTDTAVERVLRPRHPVNTQHRMRRGGGHPDRPLRLVLSLVDGVEGGCDERAAAMRPGDHVPGAFRPWRLGQRFPPAASVVLPVVQRHHGVVALDERPTTTGGLLAEGVHRHLRPADERPFDPDHERRDRPQQEDGTADHDRENDPGTHTPLFALASAPGHVTIDGGPGSPRNCRRRCTPDGQAAYGVDRPECRRSGPPPVAEDRGPPAACPRTTGRPRPTPGPADGCRRGSDA